MVRRPASLLTLASLSLVACGDDPPASAPPRDASADVSTALDASRDASADALDDAPAVKGAARVEVTHYDYGIDLATRAVTARLTLRVVSAGDCLSMGFRHAAADEVLLDGEAARDVTVANDTLLACDGRRRGWAVGRTITLSVRSTEPVTTWRPTQVGFSTRTSAGGGTFTYLLSWVGECARHGPCDTNPSTFATWRFTVTHPEGTQVLCPGTVTPGTTETVCVFDHRGGPAYSTLGVLAMSGGWQRADLGTARNVRLTLHDTTVSRITATINRPALRGFVEWMVDTFGPYPYGDELRFIVAPTYWAGFEHPGNVALAETLSTSQRLDHTARHETAHQWAGDQTTVATTRDFVWKEAMAEYLSFVYEDEHAELRDEASATLASWRSASASADHYAAPGESLPLVSYYGSAYGPGPMILFRQLEVMHSRRQVLDALRMLLGRERALTLDDVRMALEATTGASLDTYVRAWMRGTGAPAWPGATVERLDRGDGSVTVTVRVQTRDAIVRPCRFTVRLTGAMGATFDVPITVGLDGTQPAPVTVRPGFTVTGEEVNPRFEALVWPMAMAAGARWIDHVPSGGDDAFRAPPAEGASR
jgi:aminopeptidase N